MRNALLCMLAILPIFASNLNINQKNIYAEKQNQKSESHWIFSISANSHQLEPLNPTMELGFGYQSKLEEKKYFQSQRLEINWGGSLDACYSSWCVPRFSGLHYLNTSGDSRYYYLIGTGIHGYLADNGQEEKDQFSIIASFGFGVELGETNTTINNFQLSLDQPALFFGNPSTCKNYIPFAKFSYIVGF